MINNKKTLIAVKKIVEYRATEDLNIRATTDNEEAFKDADLLFLHTKAPP